MILDNWINWSTNFVDVDDTGVALDTGVDAHGAGEGAGVDGKDDGGDSADGSGDGTDVGPNTVDSSVLQV